MIKIDSNTELRKLQISDAELLAKHADNYNIWINLADSFPHPYLIADAEHFIMHTRNLQSEFNLGICYNNECIGVIGVVFNNGINCKTADFGYWLSELYWNKGIMQKSVKAFTWHIFNNYPIIRIQASVFNFNKASAKVLTNCGFNLEGIAKKSALKNNVIVDEFKFALIKPDA